MFVVLQEQQSLPSFVQAHSHRVTTMACLAHPSAWPRSADAVDPVRSDYAVIARALWDRVFESLEIDTPLQDL